MFSRAATGASDVSSAFHCNSTDMALLGTYDNGANPHPHLTLALTRNLALTLTLTVTLTLILTLTLTLILTLPLALPLTRGGPAGCTLVLSGREVGGGTASVLLPALSLSLHMRVWYPINATVSIGDGQLHRISGVGGLSSVYQSTDVVVLATFGGEGLAPVVDVDVSSLVTLSVANSSIATLDSDLRLHGLAAGSTILSVSSAPMLSVQSSITVSDTPVELSQLQVLLVTGVAWQAAAPHTVALSMTPASVPWLGSFGAVVQLEQRLASEGDVAEVLALALTLALAVALTRTRTRTLTLTLTLTWPRSSCTPRSRTARRSRCRRLRLS